MVAASSTAESAPDHGLSAEQVAEIEDLARQALHRIALFRNTVLAYSPDPRDQDQMEAMQWTLSSLRVPYQREAPAPALGCSVEWDDDEDSDMDQHQHQHQASDQASDRASDRVDPEPAEYRCWVTWALPHAGAADGEKEEVSTFFYMKYPPQEGKFDVIEVFARDADYDIEWDRRVQFDMELPHVRLGGPKPELWYDSRRYPAAIDEMAPVPRLFVEAFMRAADKIFYSTTQFHYDGESEMDDSSNVT